MQRNRTFWANFKRSRVSAKFFMLFQTEMGLVNVSFLKTKTTSKQKLIKTYGHTSFLPEVVLSALPAAIIFWHNYNYKGHLFFTSPFRGFGLVEILFVWRVISESGRQSLKEWERTLSNKKRSDRKLKEQVTTQHNTTGKEGGKEKQREKWRG